ncbi:M48 family metallopeptidase [Elongatibacter sediminis]|uniref:SprT family zinc-dependent metalloprotease n=1 Tax=Elongatibacter sediminis TaxID=3119006 RepID=A0AAW9R9M6_9GAMM
MNRTTARFRLQGRDIDFDLVRKKSVRRNVLVRFEENGRMSVSAPLRASTREVQRILTRMHDQIVELRQQVREQNRGVKPLRYRHGSDHFYLGRSYELDVVRVTGIGHRVHLQSHGIEVRVGARGEEPVRDALLAWYRRRALDFCGERMDRIAANARFLRGCTFDMRLRRMKRSWGTCSARGVITLNPMLMKAAPRYIDYVIAHELCHLVELNHSPAFYRLMDRIMPDWPALRRGLNERAHLYLRW